MRVILVLIMVAVAGPGRAQPVISLEPSAVPVQQGETFVVEVRISNYEDVRAFSIELHYNQAAVGHTDLVQGTSFSAGGGPGGIFLAPASDAARGYILAQEARIGGGGSSGEEGLLFEIAFQALAAGSTNIWFGEVDLRDAANESLNVELEGGVAGVTSPLPDLVVTRMFEPRGGTDGLEEWPSTKASLDIPDAGIAQGGKLSVAWYDSQPPGGVDAPFIDPDDEMESLGVTDAYWELTSSLSESVASQLAFSYAGLAGPEHPSAYRVARRPLGSGEDAAWVLISREEVGMDLDAELVLIDLAEVGLEAAQYALVFERVVSTESTPQTLALAIRAVYPNPVAGQGVIEFTLPVAGQVVIDVVDVLGRRVALLRDEAMPPGDHRFTWTAGGLASGVYVVRLRSGSSVHTARVTVVHTL